MKFTIRGEPIAKIRPRTFLRGNHITTWDPQHELKLGIQSQFVALSEKALVTPLKVSLNFFMPYPVLSQSKFNLFQWIPTQHRKDIDNLVKFYLDCGNDILWKDDRQIVKVDANKRYSHNPRTEIVINPTEPKSLDESQKFILSQFSPEDVSELVSHFEELKSIAIIFNIASQDEVEIAESAIKRICFLLSEIADKNASKLHKICKKCPRYWTNEDREIFPDD